MGHQSQWVGNLHRSRNNGKQTTAIGYKRDNDESHNVQPWFPGGGGGGTFSVTRDVIR